MALSLQLGFPNEIHAESKNGWTHKYALSRSSLESDSISDTLPPEEPNEETSLIFKQNSAKTPQTDSGAPTTLPSFAQLTIPMPSPSAEPTTVPAFVEPRLPTFAEPRTVPAFSELVISIRDSPPPLVHLRHLDDSTARDQVLPALADPSLLTSGLAPRPSLQANPPGTVAQNNRELPTFLKDHHQRPFDIHPQKPLDSHPQKPFDLHPQWPFENQDLNDATIQGMRLRDEGRTMPTTPMRRVCRRSMDPLCNCARGGPARHYSSFGFGLIGFIILVFALLAHRFNSDSRVFVFIDIFLVRRKNFFSDTFFFRTCLIEALKVAFALVAIYKGILLLEFLVNSLDMLFDFLLLLFSELISGQRLFHAWHFVRSLHTALLSLIFSSFSRFIATSLAWSFRACLRLEKPVKYSCRASGSKSRSSRNFGRCASQLGEASALAENVTSSFIPDREATRSRYSTTTPSHKMRLQRSIALLAAASSTYALSDSSPFFLLSTEKSQSIPSDQFATASHLEDNLIAALSKCDSNLYFFVTYPGLHSQDLSSNDAMPELQKRLKNSDYKSTVQIPEVIGITDIARVAHSVSQNCRIEEYALKDGMPEHKKKAIFGPMTFPPLTSDSDARREAVQSQDWLFSSQIKDLIANHTKHTIVLAGAPRTAEEQKNLEWEQENEPPFERNMHTDLKRDLETGFKRQAKKSDNPQDELPLFEKYQFLSPGIFMGLVVFLLLFVILYVGITAIAGLEVSYMSFSKEMGPNAQKKQQ
ncbi:hypothetical protein AC578_140 [Pseudocercospora eumusae]|uniref:Protein BIG1 n=1 Tax=Pseudocercospora eumusae TaxID=321146 RepID=A0A139GY27_9PEZI|nr:hypothetical protein AC578_140 [Pseudocercospora eumusae]